MAHDDPVQRAFDVLGASPRAEHRPGQVIQFSSDRESVLRVERGRGVAAVLTESGDIGPSVLLTSGDLLGLERIGSPGLTYEIFLLEETAVVEVSLATLHDWALEDARHGYFLARMCAGSGARCLQPAVLLHGSARQRVAHFLALAAVPWRAHERAVLLPKHQIARLLRLRPETLSRILRDFDTEGLLASKPVLNLLDADALADIGRG